MHFEFIQLVESKKMPFTDNSIILLITEMGFGVNVMSRRTLGRKIDDTQTKIIYDIKQQFKATQYVCTTADIWSTKTRSFLGATAHWVSKINLILGIRLWYRIIGTRVEYCHMNLCHKMCL